MMKDDEQLMKVIDEPLVKLNVDFFHSSFNIFTLVYSTLVENDENYDDNNI